MPGGYKHSHFSADSFGNGGNKRTAQINELLNKSGISYQEADFTRFAPAAKRFLHYFEGLGYNNQIHKSAKNNYATGRYLTQFNDFIKHHQPSYFIWESTTEYNLLLGKVLGKNKIPFVALPHNIESLVKGSKSVFTNKKSPEWMQEELSYLRNSECVFTISREEQWLLAAHGISSSYLPYYPTEQVKNYLMEIRELRKKNTDRKGILRKILLLGTFYNKPTLDGFIPIIDHLKNDNNLIINIAGYGSEILKCRYNQSNINILGSLSNADLRAVIINSDLAVINQEPSSGALTRIPELLIAGLPVLANTHAARSNYDQNGLTIFNSIKELKELIHTDLITPSTPQQPAQENYFTEFMKSLDIQHEH